MFLNVHDDKPSSMKGRFQRFSEVLHVLELQLFIAGGHAVVVSVCLSLAFQQGSHGGFVGVGMQ